MSKIVLGIDPGIANTGLSVVSYDSLRYRAPAHEVVKTSPSDELGRRLKIISNRIKELLDHPDYAEQIDAIAVEKVFHNKNVKSSMTTGAVIGLIHLIGYDYEIPVHEFTPQEVKRASGMGGSTNKEQMMIMANRIFASDFGTHHGADAALCGLCCIMGLNTITEVKQ